MEATICRRGTRGVASAAARRADRTNTGRSITAWGAAPHVQPAAPCRRRGLRSGRIRKISGASAGPGGAVGPARRRLAVRPRGSGRMPRSTQGVWSNQLVSWSIRSPRQQVALAQIAAQALQDRPCSAASTPSATTLRPRPCASSTVERTIRVVLVAGHAARTTVDLQRVDRQAVQVRQRRIAGAEVVDRDPHAEIMQPEEVAPRAARVVHHRGLGQLEREPGRVGAPFGQQRCDHLGKLLVVQAAVERLTATLMSRPACCQSASWPSAASSSSA